MHNPENIEEIKQDAPMGEKSGKRPYEKPAIIYRSPLEAMALICEPAPAGKDAVGVPGPTGVDCTVALS